MKVYTPRGDPVEILTSKGDGEAAVNMRLRTLLQLALAIGEREGLLGTRSRDENNTVARIVQTERSPFLPISGIR